MLSFQQMFFNCLFRFLSSVFYYLLGLVEGCDLRIYQLGPWGPMKYFPFYGDIFCELGLLLFIQILSLTTLFYHFIYSSFIILTYLSFNQFSIVIALSQPWGFKMTNMPRLFFNSKINKPNIFNISANFFHLFQTLLLFRCCFLRFVV